MSLSLSKVHQFRQPPLQHTLQNVHQSNNAPGSRLLGGIFKDTRHVWHAKGPSLEVRDTIIGCKVGGWEFGCILKDSNTNIVCVEEIFRPHKRLSLLAIGLECTMSAGIICFFDVFSSKVVRAIQVDEKITTLQIVDPGIEDLNLPGPLRNFDGILSMGTQGGHVYLIDICRQICEESLHSANKSDELNPCQLVVLTSKNISKIEYYKEKSVQDSNHLAIHLNAVLGSQTEHFTLKGPKGDDRIHVNREEVLTSGLYYCSQLTSLLVGYNFGAFQLWNLTSLQLIYTSPVCDEHLPVNRFALQEPADDPRAFCYIWVSYSNTENYQCGLPFAVMYSVCYESKEYHEGYGYLYQDFQYCAVRFQVELGPIEEQRHTGTPKGGYCLGIQPITKIPASKELNSQLITCDTLALCQITWSVWQSHTETNTYTLLFDLNQWYKEQMPSFTKWKACSNYMLRLCPNDVQSIGNKSSSVLDIAIDPKYLRQFVGVQRLEEHFHPSALSFDLWVLRDTDVVLIHNEGSQHLLLSQIEATGPLCLIKPSSIARQVLTLGLQPLFIEDTSVTSLELQREIILNVGLEHHLLRWLCKCASEWANGSFASAGCSLEFLINWAFQRALTLKSNCDRYCSPLFDYSQVQLDGNTANLLNSCVRQINNICTLYSYVLEKLGNFLVYPEVVAEQHKSLQMVSVYFEVLQWLVNVGLLPECPPSSYPRLDNPDKISAPYPVQDLIKFYDEKRAQLRSSASDTFADEESLLFIDNLVERKCGGLRLQKQWQDDGGSGLYPPPSLQSLIRAYLIEGAGIGHKHSLVIYLFLDLAMALDQNKYSAVITYLIKFPAVFKVSTSSIKITQAFWQLDHGDFTTALEHLLDPFVLDEDLQDWHHSIIMRSLCVQKQYNFALLYLQTARPPMTGEKDVMTAISLFVSNKMLDEAFYFMKQHHNNNRGDTLLRHLFNECSKNNTLHDLLYKNLSLSEEKSFIKFLEGSPHPASDELQLYYYLLRSRFLEAFDFHAEARVGKPDRQGLIGQNNVSRTDQVVRIFKSLLPDVSRKLVEYVRKEKKNLWREVQKPTPLSVFVHNTNEQIKYKSTLIHAALAKAKQTEGINLSERSSEVNTEETPFLRTPRACKSITKFVTPVITPRIVDVGEEDGPSPMKRLKLSPRTATFSPNSKLNVSVHSIMLTPIVKRNTSLSKTDLFDMHTPQSILKTKNLANRFTDPSENEPTIDEAYEDVVRSDLSPKKARVGLQPRRSLSRTPRQHVQFDIATRVSSSFSDQSSRMEITTLEDQILQGSSVEDQILQRSSVADQSFQKSSIEDEILQKSSIEDEILQRSSLSSGDVSSMISTKDKTNSTSEETFYSPDTSVNDEVSQKKEETQQVIQDILQPQVDILGEQSVIQSPRARKSYKRSHKEMSPVRSSPRLKKLVNAQTDQVSFNHTSSTENSQSDIPSTTEESIQSPRMLQKVKGRKPLSRQVLEHNIFSKLHTPVKASSEISFTKTEKTIVLEKSPTSSKTTTVESRLKISEVSNLDPKSPISQNSRNVNSSVSRTSVLESDISFDSDTTIGSDIFINEQPKIDIPQIPEWLKDYATSLQPKKENMEQLTTAKEPEPPVDIEESQVELINKQSAKERFEKPSSEDSDSSLEDKEAVNKGKGELDNESKRSFDDKSREVISMEIYDDLSCGSEASYAEDRNVDHSGFNELEINVFEFATRNQTQDAIHFSNESSCSSIPEAEIALIEDSPEKQEEVIVIFSSEEESGPYESIKEEGINESFERNIEGEEYSMAQYSDNEEQQEKIEEAHSYSSSSTDKLGSAEQELVEEQDIGGYSAKEAETAEAGHQQLVSKQDGEDGDSSSSSTEKWNFSDPAEIDENSGVESLPEEPAKAVEVAAVTQIFDDNVASSSIEGVTKPIKEAQVIIPEDGIPREGEHIGHMNVSEQLDNTNCEKQSAVPVVTSEGHSTKGEGAERILGVADERTQVGIEESDEMNKEQSIFSTCANNDPSLEVPESKKNTGENVTSNVEIQQEVSSVSCNARPDDIVEINEIAGDDRKTMIQSTKTTMSETTAANSNKSETEKYAKGKIDQSTNTSMSETTAANSNKSETEKYAEEKVDQSTNTTVNKTTIANSNKSETEKYAEGKIDQSTNTTMNETHAANSNKSEAEKYVEGKIDQSTNTIMNETGFGPKLEQKDLKSSKDSSSDTTLEGDPGAHQIVVTAQVHTPSKRRTEEPLIRRVTRRSSLLMSQNLDGDVSPSIFDDTRIVTNIDVSSSDDVVGAANTLTPSRLRTRARRSSQNSEIIDCQSSTSKETIIEPKVAALLRTTRSASVDDVKTYSRKRTLKRSNSVDENTLVKNEPKPPKGKGKARSVSHMPIISEERSGKSGRAKATEYATSRRLTRSQASMVKNIGSTIDLEDNNSDKTIQLDCIDPIVLLDKESYQGEQDPEEKKIYEGSSPSNSTISSFTRPTRRKSRSASVASDISLPLSPTKSVTPEKKSTRKYGSEVKTRSRKQSETGSVVSDKSEPATPPKRTRNKAEAVDVEMSKPRMTRSRENSVSSAKSDVSNSPKKSRSRRVIPTKTDLTAIAEEKSKDANETPIQKRQTRKRKSP